MLKSRIHTSAGAALVRSAAWTAQNLTSRHLWLPVQPSGPGQAYPATDCVKPTQGHLHAYEQPGW